MTEAIVIAVALIAACLTLFSGFGLGTLLMPAFALVYPVEIAIAATAVVHLANNVFKLVLVGKWADWRVVARFAPPAIIAAFIGAWLLGLISDVGPLATYQLGPREAQVTIVKIVIGVLILAFTVIEAAPAVKRLAIPLKWMPLGGALSGFFGGVSGHQGALRTAFLVRANLSKEQLIGTMAVCSLAVDLARTAVYSATFVQQDWASLRNSGALWLILGAMFAAFVGSVVGARLVKKITIESLQRFIAAMLGLIGVALIAGVV